jgi:hypothetical protein
MSPPPRCIDRIRKALFYVFTPLAYLSALGVIAGVFAESRTFSGVCFVALMVSFGLGLAVGKDPSE